MDRYDAGLLNDYGGGNVGWWQDYIRAELERAHDHYQEQLAARDADFAMSIAAALRTLAAQERAAGRAEAYRSAHNIVSGYGAYEFTDQIHRELHTSEFDDDARAKAGTEGA